MPEDQLSTGLSSGGPATLPGETLLLPVDQLSTAPSSGVTAVLPGTASVLSTSPSAKPVNQHSTAPLSGGFAALPGTACVLPTPVKPVDQHSTRPPSGGSAMLPGEYTAGVLLTTKKFMENDNYLQREAFPFHIVLTAEVEPPRTLPPTLSKPLRPHRNPAMYLLKEWPTGPHTPCPPPLVY